METNEQQMADRDLLLRLQAGDEAAFEQVYHQHKARILHNLLQLVRSPDIAAELHQDIFMRLWQYRAKIDPSRSLYAYLVTIAKHVAIDFYKKAAKEKRLQEELLLTMDTQHDGVREWLDYQETRAALEAIIDRLPPQRKLVYRFIKLDQKTYDEAAEHFGVSVGTIKDHMAKAAKFIQTEFGKPDSSVWVLALVYAVLGNS